MLIYGLVISINICEIIIHRPNIFVFFFNTGRLVYSLFLSAGHHIITVTTQALKVNHVLKKIYFVSRLQSNLL